MDRRERHGPRKTSVFDAGFLRFWSWFSVPKVERIGENVIVRGVPIFDEHSDFAVDDAGEFIRPEPLRKVDEAVLNRIVASTSNRLVSEYELPLAAGWHTPKPGDNFAPPPVKGGYRNPRVGDFEDSQGKRKAILVDMRVPADEWKGVQTLQRRSVEIFSGSLELDTCVLLGSKAPSRDLGPLTTPAHYGRAAGACVRYEMTNGAEDKESNMDGECQTMKLDAETLQALIGGFKSALMEVLTEQPAAPEEPAGDDLPPVEDGEPSIFGDEDAPPVGDEPPTEEQPVADEDAKKEAYARRDLAVKYERTNRELAEVKKQLASIQVRERTERYEKQIVGLQAEGYVIEAAKEMPYLMGLTNDAQRDAYIGRLKENARKGAPSIGNLAQYQRGEDPVKYDSQNRTSLNGQLTKEQAEMAFRVAKQKGITYDAAKAEVLNGAA